MCCCKFVCLCSLITHSLSPSLPLLFRFDDLPPHRQREVLARLMEKCPPFQSESRDRYANTVIRDYQNKIKEGVTAFRAQGNAGPDGVLSDLEKHLCLFVENVIAAPTPQQARPSHLIVSFFTIFLRYFP